MTKVIGYIPNLFISSKVCTEKQIPTKRINMDKIPAFIKAKDAKEQYEVGTLLVSLTMEEIVSICNSFPMTIPIHVNRDGEDTRIAGTTIKVPAITVTADALPESECVYDKLSSDIKDKLEKGGWNKISLKRITDSLIFVHLLDEAKGLTPYNTSITQDGKLVITGGAAKRPYDKLSKGEKEKLTKLGWEDDELQRVCMDVIFSHLLSKNLTPKDISINEVGLLNTKPREGGKHA